MRSFILAIIWMAFFGYNFAQHNKQNIIAGKVYHHVDHKPLSGVQVFIKGTTVGTFTNDSGIYVLTGVPSGKLTLVARYIGYQMVEKSIDFVEGHVMTVDFELKEDKILLNDVVVSANRNEVSRKEAPMVVNVITPRLFENTGSVCLSEGLQFQPGLRVETNCQNCGFQQVRINGLDGPYSQILIDSRPVFSALAGVYGIEQIPANMIERVEVIRGGASALFGSNAVAGTINIITREPQQNSFNFTQSVDLIGGKKTDFNTFFNASVTNNQRTAGAVLFGAVRQRSPYDHNYDGFSEIGQVKLRNVGSKAYFKTSPYSKLVIEYHNLNEFRRGGNEFTKPPHQSDITEQTDHNIHAGGVKFDHFFHSSHRLSLYSSAQYIERKSYYGAQQDPNAYGQTYGLTSVSGAQFTYVMSKFLIAPAEWTVGSEFFYDHLDDLMVGYQRRINQFVRSKSLFAQHEWKKSTWGIIFGGRLDWHSMIAYPILSPRVNVRWNFLNRLTARASFATGFRAPQTYDEDLHVTAVGGNVILISNDPQLKPEHSNSFSLSLDYATHHARMPFHLLVEGFYTDLNDVFVLEEIGFDASSNILIVRRNGSGAVVKGISIDGKFVPMDKVQLQGGFTFQSSMYKEPQSWSTNENILPQRRMFRSPNRYGYLTLELIPLKAWSANLSAIYTGPMLVQHFAGYIPEDKEETTPDFLELNARISYKIRRVNSGELTISAGVRNILNSYQRDFDKGVFRDSGYIYGPLYPRSYVLSINWSM